MADPVNPAAAFIAKHAWKARTVEVDGTEFDAVFFDWYELQARDAETFKKAEALPEAKRDEFLSHSTLWEADFGEYFAGEAMDAIEGGMFIPIAVLGMSASMESFAEMNNDGFLALVLEGEQKGLILRYNQDEDDLLKVAGSIDELEVGEGEDGDGDESDDN
jgi:hypothetical protein